jgi:hypothetical protein
VATAFQSSFGVSLDDAIAAWKAAPPKDYCIRQDDACARASDGTSVTIDESAASCVPQNRRIDVAAGQGLSLDFAAASAQQLTVTHCGTSTAFAVGDDTAGKHLLFALALVPDKYVVRWGPETMQHIDLDLTASTDDNLWGKNYNRNGILWPVFPGGGALALNGTLIPSPFATTCTGQTPLGVSADTFQTTVAGETTTALRGGGVTSLSVAGPRIVNIAAAGLKDLVLCGGSCGGSCGVVDTGAVNGDATLSAGPITPDVFAVSLFTP